MGWYGKGFEAAEEQVAAHQQTFTREFFVKSGNTVAGLRILDDEPINIRDHFVKGKGWFTCIQGIGDDNCPLCESGNKATNHFVFNVLDPTEYTDKNGNTHKNQVKIWRLGITLLRVLDKKRAKYGPLTTLAVEISKMGQGQQTSYDIEVEKAAKEVKLPEGEEPYDLLEVLKPKSRQELINIMNGVTSAPAEGDDDEDDEDIDWKKG